MSNIQHSSRTDQWFTPTYLVEKARNVLGMIDLDPASCEQANNTVKATNYFDTDSDGLKSVWGTSPKSIYLNPPGGKLGNKSLTRLFWEKLVDFRDQGLLEHAIFMGFSLEQLQTTQNCKVAIGNFPICIPSKRVRFVSPEGTFNSPTHANVICYVPGLTNATSLFVEEFLDVGLHMFPRNPA
jgi:ParB family transcriptional regulator, chromosome partitioning protein